MNMRRKIQRDFYSHIPVLVGMKTQDILNHCLLGKPSQRRNSSARGRSTNLQFQLLAFHRDELICQPYSNEVHNNPYHRLGFDIHLHRCDN